MDLLTKSNGLLHIVETIFMNLDQDSEDQEHLTKCREVNADWKRILENPRFWSKRDEILKDPWFWFKKCTQDGLLSENQQTRWTEIIPEFVKLAKTKNITTLYFKHIQSRVCHMCQNVKKS